MCSDRLFFACQAAVRCLVSALLATARPCTQHCAFNAAFTVPLARHAELVRCMLCRGGLAVDGQAPAAGEVMREVTVLPDGKGIMVATGDCRLLFFRPQVTGCCVLGTPPGWSYGRCLHFRIQENTPCQPRHAMLR